MHFPSSLSLLFHPHIVSRLVLPRAPSLLFFLVARDSFSWSPSFTCSVSGGKFPSSLVSRLILVGSSRLLTPPPPALCLSFLEDLDIRFFLAASMQQGTSQQGLVTSSACSSCFSPQLNKDRVLCWKHAQAPPGLGDFITTKR